MGRYKETWTAADVQCPFFLGERAGRRDIVCEGFKVKMKVTLDFASRDAKDAYMGRHCIGPYERCQIYRATMEKYELE